jgi:drug/metabolite transporter (DMT)-like permease
MISTLQLGLFCAFMSSVTWAIGSTSYSKLAKLYSPFRINFTRALVALPLFVLTVFLSSGLEGGLDAYQALESKHFALLTTSIFCSYALGDVFFLFSAVAIGVPGALALASSYPIGLALIRFFSEGEALRSIQVLGLIIAVVGIAAVILTDPKNVRDPESPAVKSWMKKKSAGITFGIITAFCWAMNSYTVGVASLELHAAVANTVRMGVALLLIPIFFFMTNKKLVTPLPLPVIKTLGWVFAMEAFGGSFFFAYGLSHTPMVIGGVLSSLAPVLSVPVAVALRLEKFSWARTLAILLTVSGLILLMQ